MEAKEIRLGNYYDDNGIARQVTPSTIEEVWAAKREWCKPIPLSEKWLLRLNAKKLSDSVFTYSRFQIRFLEAYNYWYVIETIDKAYITKVEFVHEWQNLIFALDGQELTLNQ